MLKLLFLLLTTVSYAKTEHCRIITYPQLVIIEPSIYDHRKIVKETTCPSETMERFTSLINNASGNLKSTSLNNYLRSSRIRVSLSPDNIKIVQLRDLMYDGIVNKEEFLIKDLKQLSNLKVIKTDSPIKINCKRCDETGQKNIKVYYYDNNKEKQVWVGAKLLRKRFALVAKNNLAPFTSNLNERLFEKRMITTEDTKDMFIDQKSLRFFKTNKMVRKGKPLLRRDLTPMTLVNSGRKVIVLIKKDNIKLKSMGISRSNGAFADFVEVTNPKTKKKFLAKVIDENKVELEL
jgi:flagella basal body P-ring formation protein FlgA